MSRLLVVGAGGHAKVVVDAAEAAGFEIAAIVADDSASGTLLGHTVSSSTDGVDADAFVIAIGDNRARRLQYERCLELGLEPATIVHPSAVLAPSASIGSGTFVAAGVVVNPDAQVGDDVILNTGSVVEHDCRVGAHAHVAPSASLCGAAAIGEGTLLGTGARVLPGVVVGSWSVCGAGAVIVDAIGDDVICRGLPARVFGDSGGRR